jgi:hypothetical protein
MVHRILILLVAVSLCLGAIACQKSAQPGNLVWEPAPFKDAIPAEYGRLVAITTTDLPSGAAMLWFESPSQIRCVLVNYRLGEIGATSVAIPRR